MATSPALPQSKTRQSAPPLKVVSEIVKNDPVEKDRPEKRVVESIPEQVTKSETKQEPQRAQEPAPEFSPANWAEILEALSLSGVAASLAANCELYSANDHQCVLKLSENHASLWNKTYESRIAEALGRLYGQEIKVSIEVGAPSVETPAQGAEREKQQSLAQAVADIKGDQHVQQLIESFNGKLDPKSIAPLGN